MRKVCKMFLMFVVAILVFQATGCSATSMENEVVEEKNVVELSRAKNKDKKLDTSITQFNSIQINTENCLVSIVGAEVKKSTGNVVKDATVVGNGIKESNDFGVKKGYDMGFMDSSNKEVSKRDAYLCLYLKYGIVNENVSQRDSVIPKFELEVSDDKEDSLILIHNSMKENYIDVDFPYGIVILKGYYDAETYRICIGDTECVLDAKLLKMKQKK